MIPFFTNGLESDGCLAPRTQRAGTEQVGNLSGILPHWDMPLAPSQREGTEVATRTTTSVLKSCASTAGI